MRRIIGERLRVGIIGAGGISSVHVAGWKALDVSIAVYSKAGSRTLADRYVLESYDSLDELIDAVDLVDILTPSASHGEIALRAIAAGVAVVCEKPLASTTAEALKVMRAAEAADVPVFPAHVVRYFPEYVRMKEQVDASRVGALAVLRFSRAGTAPHLGSWFYSEAAGGGIIRDQMIHDFDQARWMAGEVTQVYAVQNPPTVGDVVPSPVTAHVVLTHSGGAISHIQGAWGPEGMPFRTEIDIAGSDGTLSSHAPDDDTFVLDVPGASASGDHDYLPPQTHAESAYTSELREFHDAVMKGTPVRVSARDAVLAVALAETAMESVRTGAAVSFDAESIFTSAESAAIREEAKGIPG